MATHYIYVLIDPNTRQVRYVGTSSNPKQRLANHYSDKRNQPKHDWFDSLRDNGQEPILQIVGGYSHDYNLLELEKQLVQHLLTRGAPLLNVTYAGPNGSKIIYPETTAKIKAAWKRRKIKEMFNSFKEGESWV